MENVVCHRSFSSLTHLSDVINLMPPSQHFTDDQHISNRCFEDLIAGSKSIIDRERVGEVTFELLDHIAMVLKSLLQDHFRLVHLPSPLCAHWVCVMSEGKRVI